MRLVSILSGYLLVALFCACRRSSTAPGGKTSHRTGDMHEVLADPVAFQEIRGGWDYSRLPLRNPWQIVSLSGQTHLLLESSVIVSNVRTIGQTASHFIGSGREDAGSPETFWMLPKADGPIQKYPTRQELARALEMPEVQLPFHDAVQAIRDFKVPP